jgi:hypothetical protein
MIRQLLPELKEIRIAVAVAATITVVLAEMPITEFISPLKNHTLVFIGSLIPFFWALMLFESFRPEKELLGFVAGTPAATIRLFLTRALIRAGIVFIATAFAWQYLNYREHFTSEFRFNPWLLWLMLMALVLFLAQISRGMHLCTAVLLLYPLLVWNQLPVQLLYLFFVSGSGRWFPPVQISILLAFGAWHLWRGYLLNRNPYRTILPWLLFLTALPWLEYGIAAGYFAMDYHLAVNKAGRSGVILIPEDIDTRLHGSRLPLSGNTIPAKPAPPVEELLKFYGYQTDPTPFLHVIDGSGALTTELEKRVRDSYSRNAPEELAENFRIYNYLCGFNSFLINHLSHQEVKPELYRALLGELERIAAAPPASKLGLSLYSPVFWYLPRRQINPDDYHWLGCRWLLKILQPGIKARLIREAIFNLNYYRKHQKPPPFLPWENDLFINDGQCWLPGIRQSQAVLLLRLYADEHGSYPEQPPAEIQEKLLPSFSYRKTLNGFEILRGENQNRYYAHPRPEGLW